MAGQEAKYKSLPLYFGTHEEIRRLSYETGKPMVSIVDEAVRMWGAVNLCQSVATGAQHGNKESDRKG